MNADFTVADHLSLLLIEMHLSHQIKIEPFFQYSNKLRKSYSYIREVYTLFHLKLCGAWFKTPILWKGGDQKLSYIMK